MGRRLTRQPAGPLVGTSTITTVKSTNRVDSGSFGSRCCTFRRTHTSADPIRLLFIRLPLLLTLSLPLQFAPSARVVAYVSTRALWLVEDFWYDCMFWDEMGGELTRQPVSVSGDTATITLFNYVLHYFCFVRCPCMAVSVSVQYNGCPSTSMARRDCRASCSRLDTR